MKPEPDSVCGSAGGLLARYYRTVYTGLYLLICVPRCPTSSYVIDKR